MDPMEPTNPINPTPEPQWKPLPKKQGKKHSTGHVVVAWSTAAAFGLFGFLALGSQVDSVEVAGPETTVTATTTETPTADPQPTATATTTVTATPAAPAPAPTVTAAAVLPESCTLALEDGDALLKLNGKMSEAVRQHLADESAAWTAAGNVDNDGLDTYLTQLNAFGDQMVSFNATANDKTVSFQNNRDDCLEAING